MKPNMGTFDRAIRVAVALVFVGLYALNITSGILGLALIGLSVVFIATSIMSFCPLYLPLGLSTCSVPDKE
jgi:hypothetical protein